MVACLLRDNSLFETTLPDGADFCEAVPPGDVAGQGRRVFQMLHDRFADGQSVTLQGLLVDLAEQGMDADRRWLVQADTELEALMEGEGEKKLHQIFQGAAAGLRRLNQANATPGHTPHNPTPDDPVARALALANQAMSRTEQLRQTTDPGKIARVNR